MIESILDAKLISPTEFKCYKLYTSEIGSEVLRTMMDELFWEEPSEDYFTEAHFAFYDGRRSIVRGIKATIEKVTAIIAKQNLKDPNDRPNE